MSINGWKYYNHAMIPTGSPDEEVDTSSIENGEIWRDSSGGGVPLLARWTSDWECDHETDWWYIIRSGPYSIEQLSKSSRKHIKQAQKKCYVREIEDSEVQALYDCYVAAYSRYEKADNFISFDAIKDGFLNRGHEAKIYYGAYELESNRLIGFFICSQHKNYLEINVSKFDPAYMNLRPSDALHHYVLSQWLSKPTIEYVNSGSRSINHVTNVQEYKISTFGFHKAYCKLHVVYNPKIKWMIPLLYSMRKLLIKFDDLGVFHQVNAILKMEEIVRKQT